MKKWNPAIAFVCSIAILFTGCSGAAVSPDVSARKIVSVAHSDTCLRIEPNLENLVKASTVIVTATITDMQYTYAEATPYMDSTLEVKECLMGDYAPGDTLQAYLAGGYISVEDHNSLLETGGDLFPEVPKEERTDSYIEFDMNYSKLPAAGDTYLFFLHPETESLPEGLYLSVGRAESLRAAENDSMFSAAGDAPAFSKEELTRMLA